MKPSFEKPIVGDIIFPTNAIYFNGKNDMENYIIQESTPIWDDQKVSNRDKKKLLEEKDPLDFINIALKKPKQSEIDKEKYSLENEIESVLQGLHSIQNIIDSEIKDQISFAESIDNILKLNFDYVQRLNT